MERHRHPQPDPARAIRRPARGRSRYVDELVGVSGDPVPVTVPPAVACCRPREQGHTQLGCHRSPSDLVGAGRSHGRSRRRGGRRPRLARAARRSPRLGKETVDQIDAQALAAALIPQHTSREVGSQASPTAVIWAKGTGSDGQVVSPGSTATDASLRTGTLSSPIAATKIRVAPRLLASRHEPPALPFLVGRAKNTAIGTAKSAATGDSRSSALGRPARR